MGLNKSLMLMSVILFSLICLPMVMAAGEEPGMINFTYPLNTTYTINVSDINYTTIGGNGSCWYSLDNGVTNVSMVTPQVCGTNWSDITSVEGANTWQIWANNTDGFENTSTVAFFKDTITPDTVTIIYPVLNTNYSTNVSELNYTANDTNLDSCWFSIDYGVTNSTRQDCGTNWTVMNSTEGWNNWTVYVNDTLNNLNSTLVTFWKDTISPTISITYPVHATTYNGLITEILYIVNDTNLDTCWWTSNAGVTNTTITCGTNLTITTADLTAYSYTFYVRDTSDNEASSTSNFYIDFQRLSGWTLSVMRILVGFCALIVMSAAVGGIFIFLKNNFQNLSGMQIVSYFIGILVGIMLYSALIIHIIENVL